MSLNVSDAVGGTGANGEEYVTMERHQRLESALARIEEMLVASMGLGGNMGSSLPPNPTGEAAGPVRTTVGPTRAVGLTRGEVGPTATFQDSWNPGKVYAGSRESALGSSQKDTQVCSGNEEAGPSL